MKKLLSLVLASALSLSLLTGCGNSNKSSADDKTVDTLSVYFVPSREPEEIVTATEPLKDMLKKELATQGYEVNNIDITVGTSFEAVGEALSAGTADMGFVHMYYTMMALMFF